MLTLYDLKPRFQNLLRPLTKKAVDSGVTANQVTIAAVALSIGTGGLLAWSANPKLFLLLPAVLFLRMALNAIDGMIAREHNQVSKLGMFLNEIGDVVSDLALILPFVVLPQFAPWGVIVFAIAAVLSEFAGTLGIPAGAGRRYDGPMGKSDRALALGVLGVLVAVQIAIPSAVAGAIFPLLALAALITTANRVRQSLRNA
jgi:CDP-diacylglycerol--glycerol-3-phosphate 3-phosphatidyltransferase